VPDMPPPFRSSAGEAEADSGEATAPTASRSVPAIPSVERPAAKDVEMRDKRITDEMLVALENLSTLHGDMRKLKEIHIHLAQQIEGLKQVCGQLHSGMMKQAEMMGTFTKAASDNSEMVQVVGDEVKAMQADNNAYRAQLNQLSSRISGMEKAVNDSFIRLGNAFKSAALPAE